MRFLEHLSFLCEHSGRVIVLGQVPLLGVPKENQRDLRGYIRNTGKRIEDINVKDAGAVREANAIVRKLCAEVAHNNLVFLDPYDLMMGPDGNVRLFNERNLLYYDYNHVNEHGAHYVYDQLIRAQLNTPKPAKP